MKSTPDTDMRMHTVSSRFKLSIQPVVQRERMMFLGPMMIHGSVGDAARKPASHSCTASPG